MIPSSKVPISAIVLTYNEELNIENCLQGLCDWATEIFIVDSGSQDRTLEIAEKYKAKVFSHSFKTHAKQWNWAFQNLPIASEWILALDADQRLTPELWEEITEVLKSPPRDIDGFYLCRRQIFRGRWIRHGGYYPKHLLKLFRRGKVKSDENELLDFRFYVPGKTAKLHHDLIEDNQNDLNLNFWISKHTRFADLQAQEEFLRRRNGIRWTVQPSLFGTPDQRTLWLKNLWYHFPLYLRPFLYFFYRYLLRLGFLDGKQGFIFHFLQSLWYRLLVDIKIDELRRSSERANF